MQGFLKVLCGEGGSAALGVPYQGLFKVRVELHRSGGDVVVLGKLSKRKGCASETKETR